jgi:HD-GYP domain-containing protein (c-di-GMP phosphodiesterase class II)
MKYALLHPTTFSVDAIAVALESEGVSTSPVLHLDELAVADQPTAFVLDPQSRPAFSAEDLQRFTRDGGAVVVLGAAGEDDVPPTMPDEVVTAFVAHPHGRRPLLIALRSAYREAAARGDAIHARHEAATRSKELTELTKIGMALTTERDYRTLLDLILTKALQITNSDAASLYIVEDPENETRRLRFMLSQTTSRPDIPFVESTMPLDISSIAGNVAATGKPLVIDDVYELPIDVEYTFNRWFDETYGYRSKSMLTIPMTDHKDETIGVLQLINRKRRGDARLETPEHFETEVVPYSQRQVDLVSALAGQAAVSIENSQLYQDIERLFEGFVRASVTAIEQRDPTTFGHSGRVASMTVALAETVDADKDGPYRDISFTRQEVREIRYAGLLHDFGKVGVREQVLVKAKKLYPPDLSLVKQRYAFVRRTAESEFHRKRADHLEQQGHTGYDEFVRNSWLNSIASWNSSSSPMSRPYSRREASRTC